MPQVATVEQVFAAAQVKQEAAASRVQALELPTPPIVSPVVQAVVEYTFVSTLYQPRSPDEVFCVVTDQRLIADLDRRHREINSDHRLRGDTPRPTLSQETPICIARTLP